MWELDHKEGWVPKNWFLQTVMLEKTENPLNSREIKPVNTKGNQPWIFDGRTDAEAPIVWPPYVKSWLIGKDPDAGEDWGQERRGRWRKRRLDGITDSMDMSLSKLREIVKEREVRLLQPMGLQRDGHDWATEPTTRLPLSQEIRWEILNCVGRGRGKEKSWRWNTANSNTISSDQGS